MDDKSLNTLVNSLKGPEYGVYKNTVKSTFDQIFTILTEKSKFGLDRCKLVGGFGKKTSIGTKADADLVIFYNGKHDKKMIMDNFQDILVKRFASSFKHIRTTPNMIMKFKLDDIPIDLVVAENNANLNGNTIETQRLNSLTKFKSKENTMTVADLGCALTESSVEFMKKQTNFVHNVALLGKYWNHGISFKHYVYGRSFIMELLATHAAIQEQEDDSRPSIANAFKRFLGMISNLQKQYVVFHETVAHYKKSDIPKDILEQRPMLLDPINQYNNLLDIRRNSTLKHLFNVFEDAADAALKMIENGCKDQKKIFLRQCNYQKMAHNAEDKELAFTCSARQLNHLVTQIAWYEMQVPYTEFKNLLTEEEYAISILLHTEFEQKESESLKERGAEGLAEAIEKSQNDAVVMLEAEKQDYEFSLRLETEMQNEKSEEIAARQKQETSDFEFAQRLQREFDGS